jgi:hypothetical protein
MSFTTPQSVRIRGTTEHRGAGRETLARRVSTRGHARAGSAHRRTSSAWLPRSPRLFKIVGNGYRMGMGMGMSSVLWV